MENQSPFLMMQQVEGQLKALLRRIDPELLGAEEKRVVANIRRLLLDTRLDIRDYELSETRAEQVKKLRQSKEQLTRLEANVMAISFAFGPADIAQLTAQIEQISGNLL